MRGRGLIILALIVVALAVFIGLYERKLPSSDERQKSAKQIFDLKTEDVDGLTLELPGRPVVEISRRQSVNEGTSTAGKKGAVSLGSNARRWKLTKPWPFPADTGAVDSLVDALTGLQRQRELTDFKAADLGLDKPRAQVTLRTSAGERTLTVGAKIPGLSAMAVRIDGDAKAYVVGDGLWSQLNRKAGDWRSRDVLPGSRSDIQGVSWTGSEGAISLERAKIGFRVTQPYQDVADADRVDELMTAITGLRIDHFEDGGNADAATSSEEPESSTHLTVTLDDRPQPFEVELSSSKKGEVTVEYGGQRGVCKSDLLEKMGGSSSDWRSKAWTTLHVYDIQKVVAHDADGEVELSRSDSGWNRNGTEIPFDAATDLLDAVTGAKAKAVRPETPGEAKPAGKPSFSVELTPQEGGTVQSLSLYSNGVAVNSSRTVTFEMPDDLLSHLALRMREVRSAKAPKSTAATESGEQKDG